MSNWRVLAQLRLFALVLEEGLRATSRELGLGMEGRDRDFRDVSSDWRYRCLEISLGVGKASRFSMSGYNRHSTGFVVTSAKSVPFSTLAISGVTFLTRAG